MVCCFYVHFKNIKIIFSFSFMTDTFVLPEKYEPVASVHFNSNKNEMSMFVITCTNGIVFGQWVNLLNFFLKEFQVQLYSLIKGIKAKETSKTFSIEINFHKFPLRRYCIYREFTKRSFHNKMRKCGNME